MDFNWINEKILFPLLSTDEENPSIEKVLIRLNLFFSSYQSSGIEDPLTFEECKEILVEKKITEEVQKKLHQIQILVENQLYLEKLREKISPLLETETFKKKYLNDIKIDLLSLIHENSHGEYGKIFWDTISLALKNHQVKKEITPIQREFTPNEALYTTLLSEFDPTFSSPSTFLIEDHLYNILQYCISKI